MSRSLKFQSTPPRGGRLEHTVWVSNQELFQSTPPRGGRPPPRSPLRPLPCFNPRPRAGGDLQTRPRAAGQHRVSIHAPARGATCRKAVCRLVARVSIHAPARGATRSSSPRTRRTRFNPRPRAGGDATSRKPLMRMSRCFNPRPRAGGDHQRFARRGYRRVSIHAPARGATPAAFRAGVLRQVSIHAPARGAT